MTAHALTREQPMLAFAGHPRPERDWRSLTGIILIFIVDHWFDIVPMFGVSP
ncbi:hypothetical protein L1787_07630 [Acuticoccus sp. M5D2P5]|uniref:hypothetical protein n=1 Tax=Acuticoccus kalidii TaxID=2910977 RepID=UPI001F1E55B0|nr:hypothetical protein [Acuticoccus kalidii]MCF3933280.1 hypothetical protein [Acuticoccus kalidii]